MVYDCECLQLSDNNSTSYRFVNALRHRHAGLARDQLSLVWSTRNEEILIIHRGVVNYTHIISKTKKNKKNTEV